MKCKIDLNDNIKEQVQNCVEQSEIGPSPSGAKLYTCTSKCKCKFNATNKIKFINNIVKKLSNLQNESTCELDISVGPALVQNMQQTF